MTVIKPSADAVMATERAEAIQKVTDHFNRLALASLHDDLVLLAHGQTTALLSRARRKSEVLASVEAASTPAEIEKALSTL